MWLRTSSQCSAASSLDCKRRVTTKPVPTPLPRPRMVGFRNHRPLGPVSGSREDPLPPWFRNGRDWDAECSGFCQRCGCRCYGAAWVKRVKLKAGNVPEFRIITLLFGTVPPCDFYIGRFGSTTRNCFKPPKTREWSPGEGKGLGHTPSGSAIFTVRPEPAWACNIFTGLCFRVSVLPSALRHSLRGNSLECGTEAESIPAELSPLHDKLKHSEFSLKARGNERGQRQRTSCTSTDAHPRDIFCLVTGTNPTLQQEPPFRATMATSQSPAVRTAGRDMGRGECVSNASS